jgi:hypothetical protein
MTFGAYWAFQAWARSTRAVRNHFFLLMDTARYLCIPEYTKKDERRGRGPEAISQESEVKSVNCCMENYSYVHRRLLYRDVGKNLLHTRNREGRSSDTNRTTAKTKDKQRQAKTSKTKTNKGKGTRKKSTEPKTNKNQEITQARTQFPHTRSKTITNTKDLDPSSNY